MNPELTTSAFSPRASRVARAFLSNPVQYWTQKKIAEEFRLSPAHVNTQCKNLERDGFIQREGDYLKLLDGKRLLETWAAQYQYSYNQLSYFSTFTGTYHQDTEQEPWHKLLSNLMTMLRSPWALTLVSLPDDERDQPAWDTQVKPVSNDLFIYLQFPMTIFEHGPEWHPDIGPLTGAGGEESIKNVDGIASRLGLTRSYLPREADVVFLEPYDESVFYGSADVGIYFGGNGLSVPAVSLLQLYLDLSSFSRLNGQSEKFARILETTRTRLLPPAREDGSVA